MPSNQRGKHQDLALPFLSSAVKIQEVTCSLLGHQPINTHTDAIPLTSLIIIFSVPLPFQCLYVSLNHCYELRMCVCVCCQSLCVFLAKLSLNTSPVIYLPYCLCWPFSLDSSNSLSFLTLFISVSQSTLKILECQNLNGLFTYSTVNTIA